MIRAALITLAVFVVGTSTVWADDPMKTEKCQNGPLIQDIKFLEKFIPDLESGQKTATTRRGIRCVKPGQTVRASAPDGKPLGKLMIVRAYILRFQEINEELARAENTTVKGLQKGLISIYGPDIRNQDLTAIHFIWVR